MLRVLKILKVLRVLRILGVPKGAKSTNGAKITTRTLKGRTKIPERWGSRTYRENI